VDALALGTVPCSLVVGHVPSVRTPFSPNRTGNGDGSIAATGPARFLPIRADAENRTDFEHAGQSVDRTELREADSRMIPLHLAIMWRPPTSMSPPSTRSSPILGLTPLSIEDEPDDSGTTWAGASGSARPRAYALAKKAIPTARLQIRDLQKTLRQKGPKRFFEQAGPSASSIPQS